MKPTAIIGVLLFTAATAAASPCVLTDSVLRVYDRGPNATEEEWRDSRRAVSDFVGCTAADAASRKIFFAVVEREFTADHRAELTAWAKKRPDSEALWEGINLFQYELKDYMDRTVSPADLPYKATIVRYGRGKAIAALGPAVKKDVIALLGVPNHRYGLAQQYNQQFAAMEALGYWIDASNHAFSPQEVDEFTAILTGVLTSAEDMSSRQQRQLVESSLRALSRSSDEKAEKAVREWMDRHPNAGPLHQIAGETAASIKRRRG